MWWIMSASTMPHAERSSMPRSSQKPMFSAICCCSFASQTRIISTEQRQSFGRYGQFVRHGCLPSRLTLKLSGPATERKPSRHRNAPCGRVRCSARLDGATTGRKPPTPSPTGAPSGFRRRGSGDRARQGARRLGTGAARSRGPTDMDIGAAGCREPNRTPRCPSRLTPKLSGPATYRRDRAPETRPVAGSAASAG